MSANLNDRNKILQNQQQMTDQINSLIEQSAQAMLCGPDCQRLEKEESLKQKYLDAKTNLQTAPIQLEEARKQFYVFAEGQGAYNDMLEKDLKEKAQQISSLISEKFNQEIQGAKTLIYYYNTDLINSKNTIELYDDYLKKNRELEKKIKDSKGDVLTKDRKSYYENQEYTSLKNWYMLFIVLYYIIAILCFATMFPTLSIIMKFIVFLLLFLYPFYSGILFSIFSSIFAQIKSYFPKNVYT